jgi:hypothetical protein
VDNKLLMQAILLAYRSQDARPQAPPIYEEAARIRDDLLALPASAKTTEPAPEGGSATTPAAPTAGAAGAAGSPVPPPDRGNAAAQQSKPMVLRPSDLDRSKVTGQAAPVGRFPSQPRSVPQAQSQPGLRQWTRPEPTFQEGSTETVPEEGGENQFIPPQVVTPPPAGVFYRPGIQSSGRLNLEIGPARGARGKRTERG